jgi:hypothetical protein
MIDAGVYDISHPQGASFDRTFTVTVNGSALNLTGYTGACQVRVTFDDTSALFTPTVTLGGTAGTIVVTTPATTTAGVAVGNYQYDVWLTQGTTSYPILVGKYALTGRYTQ